MQSVFFSPSKPRVFWGDQTKLRKKGTIIPRLFFSHSCTICQKLRQRTRNQRIVALSHFAPQRVSRLRASKGQHFGSRSPQLLFGRELGSRRPMQKRSAQRSWKVKEKRVQEPKFPEVGLPPLWKVGSDKHSAPRQKTQVLHWLEIGFDLALVTS